MVTSCSPPSRHGLATAEFAGAAQQRPSLTASARDVVATAGRDEETSLWVEQRNEGYPAFSAAFSGGQCSNGVPRATGVLAKMFIFLAQATSARLCSFPAAVSRW